MENVVNLSNYRDNSVYNVDDAFELGNTGLITPVLSQIEQFRIMATSRVMAGETQYLDVLNLLTPLQNMFNGIITQYAAKCVMAVRWTKEERPTPNILLQLFDFPTLTKAVEKGEDTVKVPSVEIELCYMDFKIDDESWNESNERWQKMLGQGCIDSYHAGMKATHCIPNCQMDRMFKNIVDMTVDNYGLIRNSKTDNGGHRDLLLSILPYSAVYLIRAAVIIDGKITRLERGNL